MMPPGRIAIGVPVRDEVQRLPRLLDALARQTVHGSRFTVCFLLDGCEDQSETLLTAQTGRMPFGIRVDRLPHSDGGNPGRARRAAMVLAMEAAGGDANACLLTTDADSIPAPDWVETSCASLATADVVAGHILRKGARPDCWRTRRETYLLRLHEFRRLLDPIDYDPLPSHPSLGGASLAFRADVYRELGGFPAYPRGEDRALVAHARRSGFRVRHDRRVRVVTSSRTDGRAPGGLADELKTELGQSAPPLVPNPLILAKHYRKQAQLRRAFDRHDPAVFGALASRFDLCEQYLRDVAATVRSSDAFVETVAPDNSVAEQDVLPLPEAVRQLARLLAPAEEQAVA